MSPSDPKAELRRRLRAQRRALPAAERQRAANDMARRLVATQLFYSARRVACYFPCDGEIDPRAVMKRLWRMRKTAYLPVLSQLAADRLWFAHASPGMELKTNRFGIPEPVVKTAELIRAHRLDLVLLPLVAFDTHGNRLGRGGGFYDRSLEFLRHRRYWKKPHLIGLAYEFQRLERLPTNDWDVLLDGVVTERAVYMIRSKQS